MPYLNLDQEDHISLFSEVLSTMFFPEDPEKREIYFDHFFFEAVSAYGNSIEESTTIELSIDGLKRMRYLPAYNEAIKTVVDRLIEALYAINVLQAIYDLKKEKLSPSISKALFIVSHLFDVTEPTARKRWNHFKSVSHLWLAIHWNVPDILEENFSEWCLNVYTKMIDQHFFEKTLALAEFFRKYLNDCIPEFKEDSIWKVPDYFVLPEIELLTTPQTEEKNNIYEEILKEYKARPR